MQYRAFEPEIEVNGQTIRAFVDGFQHFKHIPTRTLLREGIGSASQNGSHKFDASKWYSQEAWLRAFEHIAAEVGEAKLLAIGLLIPLSAKFPPGILTITDAVMSIDVAYHMNHRKGGQVMFDPKTGKMLEGIGHYGCQETGERELTAVCENPYPCSFDRGIITTMARRFERAATIRHVDDAPCRREGAASCTYTVRW